MCSMILLILVSTFEGQIQESITKLLDTSSQSNAVNYEVNLIEITTVIVTKDDKNQETCRFFGWFIKSASDIYIDIKKISEWSTVVEKDYINILNYLKRMKILHNDALLDSEYIDNMYSYNDQLCNKGGLTLVSTEYYNFADSIMTKIRSYATF